MTALLLTALAAFALALASCAGAPLPSAQGGATAGCGDPCGTLPCPQAFTCMVTSRCQRQCVPETAVPGGLPIR